MPSLYATMSWRGDRLYCGSRAAGYRLVPDKTYPNMWRVERPDGSLSDMLNRARAKDAAQTLAAAMLDRRATAA